MERVRTIRRQPAPDRWNVQLLNSFRGLPWKYKDVETVDDIPSVEYGAAVANDDGAGVSLPDAMGGDIYTRAFKIFKADLEEYGYSASCPGCSAVRDGIGYRAHNKQCRDRM